MQCWGRVGTRRAAWSGRASRLLCAALLVVASSIASAQTDDDDEDPAAGMRPGLMAEFAGPQGAQCRRVDELVSFVWNEASPDPRLPPGPFAAVWQGKLLAMAPGEYRLYVFAAGDVRLELAGRELLSGRSEAGEWFESPPVRLTYGYHPLRLEFRRTSHTARLGLYWSGPRFALEGVPARHLFHDAAQEDDPFARGELLVHALRCAACHDIPEPAPRLPGPSLRHLRGNIAPAWLVDWLTQPPPASHSVSAEARGGAGDSGPTAAARRMPHFALARDDALALAAYLLADPAALRTSADEPLPAPQTALPESIAPEAPRSLVAAGEQSFHTLGCLACHRLGALGQSGLFDGGDLSRVAAKRPAGFFASWLADPQRINPAHRMPVFRLSTKERTELAAYLATLGRDPQMGDHELRRRTDAQQIARGRELAIRWRCAACHELPEPVALPPRLPLAPPQHSGATRAASCLDAPDSTRQQPGYHLAAADRAAVLHYLQARRADAQPTQAHAGRLVLAERNCLACHARENEPGIESQLAEVVARFPALEPLLPAWKPPALFGVGDKLHDEALRAAVATSTPPLRPWLAIRMPRFALSDAEMQALRDYFVHTDRIPPRPTPAANLPTQAELRIAGTRLVTSSGFGCTSCHQIGQAVPQKVELKSRGTDLSLLGQRIRRSWYDRWMPNPARIVPRMEMPSLVTPIQGVLGDDLSLQLEAVWHVLNQPGFTPPRPEAVRIVRRRNDPSLPEPAHVLTDVFEVGSAVYIKPWVAALPNRHTVLLDLEQARLAHWWMGDAARLHTRGKSWYWEPGGAALWNAAAAEPSSAPQADAAPSSHTQQAEIALLRGGVAVAPLRRGQFVAQLDGWQHVPHGVRVHYRLIFPRGHDGSVQTLRVEETFLPRHGAGDAAQPGDGAELPKTSGNGPATPRSGSGFVRHITVRGLRAGQELRLHVVPDTMHRTATLDGARRLVSWKQPPVSLRVLSPPDAVFHATLAAVDLTAASDGVATCQLGYESSVPVDRYLAEDPPLPVAEAQRLQEVPGFEVVRLPLPSSIMPTALAARGDGTLVVATLTGEVFAARDTDGDGLHDALQLLSDDLAAPYGVAVAVDPHTGREVVDVIHKGALLRLHDEDGDGRAERTVVLAAGWGHTADYHDWAVGLPRDAQGCYYVALPCQQDDRSLAAAHLRGRALRLVPRQPTPDEPWPYAIEVLCSGLRFPMGLALSRQGDLFATDNQGNYNPFNELNHLQPGRHYGFINKLEFRPGQRPQWELPAINIPHPWTRSVNGICFLDTPEEMAATGRRSIFGPLEGQLLACEYDTRRLVRLSLQRVGDTFQGAAYPLSDDPPPGSPTMLGPLACTVAPDGSIYVGSIRDSAWGGGANTGEVVRLRFTGTLPPGIARVEAVADGFVLHFTAPVSAQRAADVRNYGLSAYRRVSTAAYGGPDVDRSEVRIQQVTLADDRRSVRLRIAWPRQELLAEGLVYELRVRNLAELGDTFFPAEAHYTLRAIPR